MRNQDGALCRDDTDCNWIQEDLVCHDTCLKPYVSTCCINFGYDSRFIYVFLQSDKWFLGDYRSIKGRCDCPKFYFWDDTDMECKSKIVRFFLFVLFVLSGLKGINQWSKEDEDKKKEEKENENNEKINAHCIELNEESKKHLQENIAKMHQKKRHLATDV